MTRLFGTAVLAAALAPLAVLAQDPAAAPSYGDVSLSSGFTPDPYTVDLSSGGSLDASRAVRGDCAGFIADAPDFDLYYNSGSFPLIISVDAEADTTLVVNGPDGRWHCDDDSGDGFNPSVRFSTPASGLYNIWVGTYGDSTLEAATLSISELYSQ